MEDNLNSENWIGESLIEWESNQSLVLAVQTSDMKRITQFMQFVLQDQLLTAPEKPDDPRGEGIRRFDKVFEFSAHMGLHKLVVAEDKAGNRILVRKAMDEQQGGGDAYEDALKDIQRAEGGEAAAAVLEVDGAIKDGHTLFIMKNIPEPNTGLTAAISDWCNDEPLYEKESLIVLFSPEPSRVIAPVMGQVILSEPPLATDNERKAIIESVIAEFPTFDLKAGRILEATKGLNMAQTEAALLSCIFRHQRLDVDAISGIKRAIMKKTGMGDVTKPEHDYSGVGGFDSMKDFFDVTIAAPLQLGSEWCKANGVEMPMGVLLYGFPGNGKTYFVHALAGQLGWNVVEAPADLRSPKGLYGESEARLASFLKLVEASAPCIALFDEVEGIAGRRDQNTGSDTDTRMTDILLRYLTKPDRKAFVCCCTNFPEQLDEAFIREGRMDVRVPFPHPDRDARVAVLKVQTEIKRKVNLADDVDLEAIAGMTSWYTCAQLEGLVKKANARSLARSVRAAKGDLKKVAKVVISQEDFLRAFAATNIRDDAREKAEAYLNNGLCTHEELVQQLQQEIKEEAQQSVTGSRAAAAAKKLNRRR